MPDDNERLVLERGLGVTSRLAAAQANSGSRSTDGRGLPVEISVVEAFSVLDEAVRDWVNAVGMGMGYIPRDWLLNLPRGSMYEQVNALTASTIPWLRRTAFEAREQVSFAAAAKTPAERDAAVKKAGVLYQAALIATEAAALKINMVILLSYADEVGEATGSLRSHASAFDKRVTAPLNTAINMGMRTNNVNEIASARDKAEPDITLTRERLAHAEADIKANASVSRRVILVADFLMLAHSFHRVTQIPVAGGPPGISQGPRPGPPAGILGGGGGSAAQVMSIDVKAALEAIKKLIAIGAIDARILAMVGGAGAMAALHQKASNVPGPDKMLQSQMSGPGGGSPGQPSAQTKSAKPGTPAASSPATPGVPQPQVFNRTLAQLKKFKVDVNDKYTLDKLTEIYMRNRNPEALLMHARAGTGELRVLIRYGRQPGVQRVRFVRPSNLKGEHTPDIEVTWKKGVKVTAPFVEVRTLTDAPKWMQVKHAKTGGRTGVVATPEFINGIDQKLRLGQISMSRPGVIAFHAPHQTVTQVSLEGWRDVFRAVLKRGPLPKGILRIEITGGTGPMLIFEPPKWTGLIVK